MELAVGVSGVDQVITLRRFSVPLLRLGTHRLPAQGNSIGLKNLPLLKEGQSSFGFFHQHLIGFFREGPVGAGPTRAKNGAKEKEPSLKAHGSPPAPNSPSTNPPSG